MHLVLVDGSTYVFRAYHALPPLTRKTDGLPTGCVKGFTEMLFKLTEDLRGEDMPTHFAVIFELRNGDLVKREYVPLNPRKRFLPPLFFKGVEKVTHYRRERIDDARQDHQL